MTERASINLDNLIDLGSFEVSAAEKEQYGRELADFLEYARVINGAPQHLPPASHAVEREQLLRNDSAAPFPEREALMANAPALQGSYRSRPRRQHGRDRRARCEGAQIRRRVRGGDRYRGARAAQHGPVFLLLPHGSAPGPSQHPPGLLGPARRAPGLNREAVRMARRGRPAILHGQPALLLCAQELLLTLTCPRATRSAVRGAGLLGRFRRDRA